MHNAKIFSYPITIKESHLDTFGHVNNAAYLTLLEEARWEFLTQNGYGLDRIHEIKQGPVILEIKLAFLKELCLRAKVIIETKMISYENKIGRVLQRMISNGEVAAEAEIVIGLFDLSSRKLILPTQEWLHAIGIENINPS